jgi:glycosyltransferase involved in cell wall biosynthesis
MSFRLAALASLSADAAIFNTHAGAAYHRHCGFRYRRSITIDNGINADRFVVRPEIRAQTRKLLGIGEDEIVVLAIARVDPMKGWDRLLRIAERIPGIRLVAVGHGTETFEPHPSRLALGAREDVPALLAAADLFVSGSRFGEGTSVALTEAMAAALPIVATNVGDHARIVDGCGCVIDPADDAGLEAAIRELASDPTQRRRYGAAAAVKVQDAYDVERALDAYYRVYGEYRS